MIDILVPKLTGYDRTLVPPPDKSISVRAVIALSFAVGNARVSNISHCDDVMSAVDCMRRLGSNIRIEGGDAYIEGAPFTSGTLFCRNSATAARILIGLLSGLNGVFTVDGDDSLRSRPMDRIIEPLTAMGARLQSDNGRLPVKITGGALRGIDYEMPIASAQVKSALLFAGLNAAGSVSVTEKVKTRDHTEIMLNHLNARVNTAGNTVTVSPSVLYSRDIVVPGDISAAVYPMCIALCLGGRCSIKRVGLNGTRTAVLDFLREIGASVTVENRVEAVEPYGDVTVAKKGKLVPFNIDGARAALMIDEIPALCALACHIDGTSVISGAEELRNKESDRIAATVKMLRAMGAHVEERTDGMVIHGGSKLEIGRVETFGDHRIAMSAAVAGCVNGVVISDAECVNVSYPRFFEEVIGVYV